MGNIKKCLECNVYTLADTCSQCGGETTDPGPPAFSFPDKYGKYRREVKSSTSEG
ncbi:MAG: RNA-protein complex protein Nop10 [Candidatus Nanohaloarchaea archaeon]|nr:RNA-protein complex protein Nop10 [Candidatus Nanohaloarchaea archaeon]